MVGDVDVLPRRGQPRTIILGRGLRACIEALALVARDLHGRPGHVEVGRQQVAVRIDGEVLVAAARRTAGVERERLRPALAGVVGVPFQRRIRIADRTHVDVASARRRRRVGRD